MKLVHRGIRSVLDGLYRCHDEILQVTTSQSSYCRLIPLVISFYCDIPEAKGRSCGQHGTTVDLPSIQYLVTRPRDLQ